MWSSHSKGLANLSVFAEWRVSETRCPTGTAAAAAVEEEEEAAVVEEGAEVAVVAGVPADKGGLAVAGAGREAPREPSGCTSSRWPKERGPWRCTTLYPSGRAASRSTAPSSSSARTTW